MNKKGISLFWDNYYRAFDWQNNSQISHWKARVKALEVENALLREFIQHELHHGTSPENSQLKTNSYNDLIKTSETNSDCNEDFCEETEHSYSECEIDEELLAFYEKTMRHKMERKKKQSLEQKGDSEDSQSDTEKIYTMGPVTSTQRSEDMAFLYGNDAPKILSMELSMQINFDMNRNKSNPQLWPNIPLRLSR